MSRVQAKRRLISHPDFPAAAIEDISATVTIEGGRLKMEYLVNGRIEALRIPAPMAPERTDELWQHSCCEAFLAMPAGYVELNFSPSSQWAAYRFDGHRQGRCDLDLAPPVIGVDSDETQLMLTAVLDMPMVVGRLGLSAVIVAMDGSKSYWALAHPRGKPDFHHPDCFALDLSAWRQA